ncbi:MAG: metallophosphoesterase, partial [Chloroflexota bacterium]|nr:metallophosphoesterase [Chloroflexota bacterium]
MMHTRRMRRMPRLSPALCTLLAQRGKVILLIALLLILIGGFPVPAQAASPITFTGDELLGKPTDDSITVNIVPDSTIEYHYQYGVSSGTYTGQTSNTTATGGQPHEIVISGLAPNTKYYYRMRYHAPGGAGDDWVVRGEHSFWTQRTPGSAFKFTVTSDSHAGYNAQYQKAIANVRADEPDFHLDLGDTFMLDGYNSQSAVNNRYLEQRDPLYMDGIGHSAPIFLASGNHEEEEGWNLDDSPFSKGVASIQARKAYFPTPTDDGSFYSGNTDPLAAIDEATYGDELREDYYAWEWGDALFVVIDPFQYTMNLSYNPGTAGEGTDDPLDGDQWSWTLGAEQFDWLKQTLESSNAKYKFMFSHQMVGGIPRDISVNLAGYVRGGAEAAGYFEWGGKNADGSDGWAAHRDTNVFGTKPIHQLMVENGVSAYFHGHDHQYVYETRDGIVYQEVPSPSMTGSGFDGIYTAETTEEYETLAMYPSTGHLRVTVTPGQATVEYVRSNQTGVSYTYTIAPNEVNEDPPGVVTLDGAASSDTADDVSEVSFAHTTGTGDNRLTLVGVSWNSDAAARPISTVTFTPDGGGAALPLTEVISQKHGSNYRYAAIYSLLNPPSGQAGTVTITFSGGTVTAGIVAGAANFAGVDQTTPLGTAAGAYSPSSNTTATVTLSGLAGDELVFDTLFLGGNPPVTVTPDAGQTQIADWNKTVANARGAASTEQAASDSVTMSWTAASSSMWVISAVPINPAAAGATHTLTVAIDPAGGGTTTPAVGSHTCAEGSVVPVTATAAAGYAFDHWSGDCTGSGTCQVTMTADKTVT